MRLVTGFDLETTGLSFEAGHRVIEVAMVGYDLDTQERKFGFVRRVNPGRSIDPKAQLIHRISAMDLIGKPSFGEVEPFVTRAFNKSDLAIAHNAAFDVGFLLGEYQLLGKPLPNVKAIDTMTDARWATSFGKLPSLEELCYACEVDYDRNAAHSALYDVDVMLKCFFFGLKHGGYHVEELLTV